MGTKIQQAALIETSTKKLMISKSQNKFLKTYVLRPFVAWAVLLCLIIAYWIQIHSFYRAQVTQAVHQTQRDTLTTAHALAYQSATMFDEIDYIAQQLSALWVENNDNQSMMPAVKAAQKALPEGMLAQVSVTNIQGQVLFSSLTPTTPGANAAFDRASIADQEHFRVHVDDNCRSPHMFISRPVMGHVSKQWRVQFSRPICVNHQLTGVIVLSATAKHMSNALHDIFPNPGNAIAILSDNGEYLARSSLSDQSMGQSVPQTRPYQTQRDIDHGNYEAIAKVDGIERIYGWHRISGYPVVVTVGLNKDAQLAPTISLLNKNLWQNTVSTFLLLIVSAWITYALSKRKKSENTLKNLSQTDPLTNIPNRRRFIARLQEVIDRCHKNRGPGGVLLMVDVDHFKSVNDTYGHPIGDVVLKHIAKILSESLQPQDIAGRLGGEEFGILLPGASVTTGGILANRIRETLNTTEIETAAGIVKVSISLGLAAIERHCQSEHSNNPGRFNNNDNETGNVDSSVYLSRADEALYRAKHTGRNRVCVWENEKK